MTRRKKSSSLNVSFFYSDEPSQDDIRLSYRKADDYRSLQHSIRHHTVHFLLLGATIFFTSLHEWVRGHTDKLLRKKRGH